MSDFVDRFQRTWTLIICAVCVIALTLITWRLCRGKQTAAVAKQVLTTGIERIVGMAMNTQKQIPTLLRGENGNAKFAVKEIGRLTG